MHHNLLLILFLLFIVFMLIMIGQKIKVSYPILLVLAGLAIGFTPGMPLVSIDPELIFLIFLPPLLYEAAWFTSWGDFWEWRRPIGMLAFGLVIITSLVVAFVSVQLIPGFTMALGFLLGGIISPPDAVAATSVLKNVKVPKRVVTILEGESLVNDASSLIVFRFALAAVITGQFSLQAAVSDFFIVSAMGIVIGLVVAHIVYVIHRFFPTTSNIDTALTLMTPYFMYMAAEQFHFSGVMAVVSGGLFLSYRSHEILTSGSTRLQAYGVWSTTIFVLNGLVFILIGLELPVIVADLGGYSVGEAIGYGLIISLVAIVVRMLWVFPIAYVPKWFGQVVRMDHKNPTWKAPTVVGWAGMRGVVSLASALSVPVLLNNGQPFPHRNLILVITFIVILVTLVFQGLTLPFLIKWLGIVEIDDVIPEEEQEAGIQLKLKKAALARLTENYAGEIEENELVRFLKKDLEDDISSTSQWLESLECEDKDKQELEVYNRVLADLYQVKRKELFRLKKSKEFSDEEIRKQEAYLDLDEAKNTQTQH